MAFANFQPNEIAQSAEIAFDIETTGLSRRAQIVSAAVAFYRNGKVLSQSYRLSPYDEAEDDSEFQELLSLTLFNPHYTGKAIFHNMSFDLKLICIRFARLLGQSGDRFPLFSNQFCTLVDTLDISRLLNPGKFISHADPAGLRCHSLKYLSKEYGISEIRSNEATTFQEATNGLNIRLAEPKKLLAYNELDARTTLRLHKTFREILRTNPSVNRYYDELERHHSFNIFHLTWYGVEIDKDLLTSMSYRLASAMAELEVPIYRAVGREINISSNQQLSKALFGNPNITYKPDLLRPARTIPPFGRLESGLAKVDLDTLKSIRTRIAKSDPTSNFLPLSQNISRFLEMDKSLSKIESLERFLVREGDSYWVDPNISASAKSGRINCSSPSLLGLPKKIFKKSGISVEIDSEKPDPTEALWESLKEDSIRDLIKVPDGNRLARIDISGLDIVVIAWGANQFSSAENPFYWTTFLKKIRGKSPDPHYCILQRLAEASKITSKESRSHRLYSRAFGSFELSLKRSIWDYYPTKVEKIDEIEGIEFLAKDGSGSEFVPFPDDSGETKTRLEILRDFSKKLNLATSYLIGAPQLAMNLADATRDIVSVDEAQELLDLFYKVFPEIRRFQDSVANAIFRSGWVESPFGRRFYADTWADLNAFRSKESSLPFEFITRHGENWFHLSCYTWAKSEDSVVNALRVIDRPFGLKFDEIQVRAISRHTFREKKSDEGEISIRYKSESQLEEISEFELNRIAITAEIERELAKPWTESSEELDFRRHLFKDGQFFIPESSIYFYRTKLGDPSSEYFKRFTPFIKSAKKFFPMYCQGIANSVAKTCLTQVRSRIERELPDARVLFFIHDEIVVMVSKDGIPKAKEILVEAVEDIESKRPFNLPFSGKFKELQKFE